MKLWVSVVNLHCQELPERTPIKNFIFVFRADWSGGNDPSVLEARSYHAGSLLYSYIEVDCQ